MRRSDHPGRPSASTCCCLLSPKTWLMAAKEHAFPAGVNVSAATCGGRFSGVHQWPVLGVHRGLSILSIGAATFATTTASADGHNELRGRPAFRSRAEMCGDIV